MRTGAAAGHTGYFHEAAYYGSDDELLGIVIPFLRGGVAAGEPTVVSLTEPNAELVRDALPSDCADGVTFLAGGDMYARPASAIRSYRSLMADFVAGGAGQIRIIGELPPTELGATWDWWARYESAINQAYDEFPLWSMCAYSTTSTPAAVLADVARTHPHTAAVGDRHLRSADYTDPERFLSVHASATPDPLQLTPPAVTLQNPAPAEARRAVSHLNEAAPGGVLPAERLDDLRLALTEVVANGLTHGLPPVTVRCWSGPDRLVVTVTDRGQGPKDPFAGLQAADHAPAGGFGLWLTHQLCDHVALSDTEEGFTLRMIVGNAHHRVTD
ncbi:sensor histidine kinase [Actinophytocola oryzae]|uniref:Anti-sigma regulatory factor (Ser/Thr protein kinase) n=1 Tax=Actinophytocola oryzae TaxID=502181 RepID=A0A4V3FV25_9PSEU|nr:sensor histidine kinase [Actinophytocola oryzae]TDV57511.1 anti-sigma regulatory factor (Ser/Thr protein kinase) [Actinophytocola oryzae]